MWKRTTVKFDACKQLIGDRPKDTHQSSRSTFMPRIWLRLELFELGLLPLPSKYAATLTLANVKKSLDALHVRFEAAKDAANGSEDTDMVDVNMSPSTVTEAASSFIESDNLNSVSFPFWRDAVSSVFQWRDQDYKAFWLLLVQFHRKIPVKPSYAASPTAVFDEEQCLLREEVPVFKVAIYLFIQTVKPHSWRSKYSLESFNAVWYREHAAALDAAAAVGGASSSITASSSSIGNRSPQLKGSASPTLQASPHTMGLQDRSTSDAYYLEFAREKLDDLFTLLYPSIEMKESSNTIVSADQIDLLGFLLCVGTSDMVDTSEKLSSVYPSWLSESEGEAAENDTFLSGGRRADNGAKVCAFLKEHLSLNERLYPSLGFSLNSVANFLLSNDTSSSNSSPLQTPTVLSNYAKTTIVKHPEEFADSRGNSDLIIFSCHDATNVMITACNNCRIITAPNTGILSMDRCENVHVTAISGLIRVSNCLDSMINAYTLVPMIMSGENVGVELGPFNTKYSGLGQQLADAQFRFHPESLGAWNVFLNLDSEKDPGVVSDEKAPIVLQPPASFREICVPVKISGAGTAERVFPLPSEYTASLKIQQETVDSLRHLVSNDDFDLTTKRTMEMVIQLRFKEWLSATGNARQILDLVHIEKNRSAQQQQQQASPMKELAS
uniref:C-CAP/cofactor C-like domain-containing protein n=1 Tax=Globisporangium ultimum (strain ATCC 200006 / CBS 805.95 / DAOM BR144) TaxID=431595 RepID=K3WA00_GLOUD